MKIMANHSSATTREETPHVIKSTNNNTPSRQQAAADGRSRKTTSKAIRRRNGTARTTISKALKRRAEAVIKDRSIDAESRALIRYGLETNDPLLAELVRRAEAGETIIETIVLLKHPKLTPRIQTGKRSKH